MKRVISKFRTFREADAATRIEQTMGEAFPGRPVEQNFHHRGGIDHHHRLSLSSRMI
jgi:hypothetical protein